MKKGFTIIELLFVLGITAIMVALTIPAFHKSIRGNAVSNGTSELANTLALARQLAVTQRTRALVAFPTENSFLAFGKASFGIYVLTNALDKNVCSNWVMVDRWQHLPQGAYVHRAPAYQRDLQFAVDNNVWSNAPLPCVEFNASGQVVGNADVTITIQEGTQIANQIINVNSANQMDTKVSFVTGKVKVVR